MSGAPTQPTLTDALASNVPGIYWPAVVGARDATVLALLFQMESTQWLSAEALRERQNRQLGALLDHARRHCPFYHERLPNDLARWHDIPLLTRADLQTQVDGIRATTYPRAHGKTFDIATGGSTAEPVTVRRTALTQLFWQAATLRDHLWHRRDLSSTMAIIRQFPEPVDSTKPGRWGGVLCSGPAWHLPISTAVEAQLRWLRGVDPDILLTYPANLDALLTHMHYEGATPPRLREVRTISGTVTAALRERCQQVLGVPLTDLYSAQEVGVIALQCPDSGLLHVQSEHVLVEVLDEQGQPCREGEIGQVVVTDLHNFAMPLIRYALRDWAEVGPPCSCGRGLPTLRRVVGRSRNMAMSPEGKRFWPVLDTKRILEAIPHLRQYQFEQTAENAITARLVCAPAPSPEQLQKLQATLEQMLGHTYRWTWELSATPLSLSASGKFEEFVSRVAWRGVDGSSVSSSR
ncbi:MAG: phenylacetate--CoA ligase family protein [Thiomonas sp.]